MQGLLIALFSLVSIFATAQTNKKTQKKESKQDEEINKNYSRPKVKKKRDDYLKQTRDQRLGVGNEKGTTKGQKDETYLKRTTDQRKSSGDQKYLTKSEKETRYVSRTNKQRNYSGTQKYMTRGEKEEQYLNRTSGMNYQGNVKKGNLAHLSKREENKHDMEKYSSGDIAFRDLEKRKAHIRKNDKKISEFTGNYLEQRDKRQRQLQKDMGTNSGDIALRDLEKRAKQRRVKAKMVANFSGSIKTSDLQKWGKKNRKREKEIANFEGNIKLAKRKKGAHPSAAYKGGKVANSYSQKERMRKKMIKKSKRKGDIEKPAHLKQKKTKAKFNADESEIWW